MSETILWRALADLTPVFLRFHTWRSLAAVDIRSKYRRTFLGPWWITASNGIFAFIIGTVSGRFLGSNMEEYLPFFITGMTIWGFVSSAIIESCTTLIQSGGLIRATNMPLVVYIMRMVQRNFIIFLHNSAVIPIVWLVYPWHFSFYFVTALIGFFFLYVCVSSVSLAISIVCVRYRDVPPIVTALVQVLFFTSPIIWQPSQLRGGHEVLLFNPIAHLLAITRDPLLGKTAPLLSFGVSALTAVVCMMVALVIYSRYKKRVVFWV